MEQELKSTTVPSNAVGDGRDRQGRFVHGNRCSCGYPYQQRVQRLRATLLRTLTAAQMRAIVTRLIDAAKGGDVPAARTLLLYGLGHPRQEVEVTTPPARIVLDSGDEVIPLNQEKTDEDARGI